MHFTRPRELLAAGLIGLVVMYLIVQIAYDDMPRLPASAGVTLLVLGLVEAVLGYSLRSRIREGRFVRALTAARAVALAKASSLLGALMFGGWVAVLVYVVPRSGRMLAAEHDVPSALIGAVCAAALIGAALWLEYSCRTPDEQLDEQDRQRGEE